MKSRRNFIQKSTAFGLGSGLISGFSNFLIAKDLKNNSPNETINFGVIGCKGQGWSNMRSILKNKNTANIKKMTYINPLLFFGILMNDSFGASGSSNGK